MVSARSLTRRIVALEDAAKQSATCKRNLLFDLKIQAMARALDMEELQELLAVARTHGIVELSGDACDRVVHQLEKTAAEFGVTIHDLLTASEIEPLPCESGPYTGKTAQPVNPVSSLPPRPLVR
jgi:hypothetical protein